MAAEVSLPKPTYTVVWSEGDGEWVATVTGFPSLSWLAPSPGEALAGLVGLLGDVLVEVFSERSA